MRRVLMKKTGRYFRGQIERDPNLYENQQNCLSVSERLKDNKQANALVVIPVVEE